MADVEYRSAAAVEVRGSDDAPRIYLRAIVAGEQSADRSEVFDVLPEQPEGGVVLGRCHPAAKAPILRAQLEERDGALILDCEIPDTAAGRDLRTEVQSGLLPMASIEFRALADRVVGGVRRIGAVDCPDLRWLLVPLAAYPSATAEVRRRRRRRGAVVADARPHNRRHHNPRARRG